MRNLTLLTGILFSGLLSSAQPVLSFQQIVSGLSAPVDVVSANDGTNRLFVVEQPGLIRIVENGTLLPDPFLDLSSVVTFTGDERGLLSMAFHPRYDTNGYFFVYYTVTNSTITSIVLARYQVSGDPDIADAGSGVVLMTIDKPAGRTNHNGGKLNFGPDGMLFFATGDGGSGGDPDNLAQNGLSLLGKMIRIDVDSFYTGAPFYTIPSDNPYVTDPGIEDEIWSLGLRNPFRWSFDALTGDVWIGDVGQSAREEVNYLPYTESDSANYGWRCYEGSQPYNTTGCGPAGDYIFPVFDYPRTSTGGTTVTGGIVYRGSDYPDIYGMYIFADYGSDNVWMLEPDGGGGFNTYLQQGLPGNIVGFGEDEDAELYAVSINGTLYQVQSSGVLPARLTVFSGRVEGATHKLYWKTSSEQNLEGFTVEYSADGNRFNSIGSVIAMNNPNGGEYGFTNNSPGSGLAYYRLRITDIDGRENFSPVITVDGPSSPKIKVYPALVRNGSFQVQSSSPLQQLQIIDAGGRMVYRQQLNGASGYFTISLPSLGSGTYQVLLTGNGITHTQRIFIHR